MKNKRNAVAASLSSPLFRKRVVEDKKSKSKRGYKKHGGKRNFLREQHPLVA